MGKLYDKLEVVSKEEIEEIFKLKETVRRALLCVFMCVLRPLGLWRGGEQR